MAGLCERDEGCGEKDGMLIRVLRDMSPQVDIFQAAIAHFESEQEEVRAAAAFAAGEL